MESRNDRMALVALLLAAAAHASASHAATVSLTPVRDNTLFQSATGSVSNGSGPALFAGMNSTAVVRRALLRFDVVGALPAGSIIQNAELHLTVSNTPNSNPTTIDVHRMLADWGEGTSSAGGGGGAPAESLDATWLHSFYPGIFWTLPGGDFDPTVHATATIADVGTFVWTDAALAGDVQDWLSNPSTNFGWMLRGDEATLSSARRFDSREAVDPATRPTLVVKYRKGPTSVDGTSWGRTKALYR